MWVKKPTEKRALNKSNNAKIFYFFQQDREGRAAKGEETENLSNAFGNPHDLEILKQCLKMVKRTGDKTTQLIWLRLICQGYLKISDFKQAIYYEELHLKLEKELGDRTGEGQAYISLGYAFFNLKDFAKAIKYHQLALAIFKETGDRARVGDVYGNLGLDYENVDDFKKAIYYYEFALEIAKENDNKKEEECIYGKLCKCYYKLGDSRNGFYYLIALVVGEKVINMFNQLFFHLSAILFYFIMFYLISFINDICN